MLVVYSKTMLKISRLPNTGPLPFASNNTYRTPWRLTWSCCSPSGAAACTSVRACHVLNQALYASHGRAARLVQRVGKAASERHEALEPLQLAGGLGAPLHKDTLEAAHLRAAAW